MKAKSFTIHTEFIDGTLDGARNIYMGASSTCHLYVIPRSEIILANAIPDISGQPAFYILIGENETGRSQAYIGQTTDFANRKNDHLQKKDWWTKALVFISDNHKIYGDDVRFLEYLGITAAYEADSYEILNAANPRKPNIAPFRINDMEVFFRDIELLADFYGCQIFNKIGPAHNADSRHLFFVKAEDRPANGRGYLDEHTGKFVILKGSVFARGEVGSYRKAQARQQFIADNCKTVNGEIVLQHDQEMDSPSGASSIILGRPSNGWTDWVDGEGRTLKSVYRH